MWVQDREFLPGAETPGRDKSLTEEGEAGLRGGDGALKLGDPARIIPSLKAVLVNNLLQTLLYALPSGFTQVWWSFPPGLEQSLRPGARGYSAMGGGGGTVAGWKVVQEHADNVGGDMLAKGGR